MLGAKGTNTDYVNLSRKVKSIQIENSEANSYGTYRYVQFYDEKDSEIGFTYFWNPLFSESVAKKAIDGGYELIGVSGTIGSSGNWLFFLVWPEQQAIV